MQRFLLLLVLVLCACVPQPSYTVRVQGAKAANGFCGGYGVDERHVLTMFHCVDNGFDRVVKQNGEWTAITVVQTWPDVDLALLETESPLGLTSYAQLEEGDFGEFGDLFGFCPLVPVARPVLRSAEVEWRQPYCQTWQVIGSFSCSGDSGGTIQQNGKVAGMLVTIWDWGIDPDMLEGNVVCIVPASVIQNRLDMYVALSH